jgi:hypothetical protein
MENCKETEKLKRDFFEKPIREDQIKQKMTARLSAQPYIIKKNKKKRPSLTKRPRLFFVLEPLRTRKLCYFSSAPSYLL